MGQLCQRLSTFQEYNHNKRVHVNELVQSNQRYPESKIDNKRVLLYQLSKGCGSPLCYNFFPPSEKLCVCRETNREGSDIELMDGNGFLFRRFRREKKIQQLDMCVFYDDFAHFFSLHFFSRGRRGYRLLP